MESLIGFVWVLLPLVLQNGIGLYGASMNVTRPDVVNVGALFGFSSIVGKVAQVAVRAAVEDINSDPSVLGGTELKLTMKDTNYSGFLGIVEGNLSNLYLFTCHWFCCLHLGFICFFFGSK